MGPKVLIPLVRCSNKKRREGNDKVEGHREKKVVPCLFFSFVGFSSLGAT